MGCRALLGILKRVGLVRIFWLGPRNRGQEKNEENKNDYCDLLGQLLLADGARFSHHVRPWSYSSAESLDGGSRLQAHSFVWHVTDYRS